ncbi:MAG: 50S ribosomal protein L24 [Muribaculaceae bacterium]|nr:50S ribosomal protein L24 [Muribaculaceae bacterium]
MSKLHIKKGDTVYVLAGDDKGQQGRVLSIQAAKNRAIVEGINIVSKSTKPTAKHPQGGIVKMEAPINLSNLALIDPKSGKPTRVGVRVNEKGEKVRYSKKSGEEIK